MLHKRLPSFLKAACLAALVACTFGSASLLLSSCGGGGDASSNTPDMKLAKKLAGTTITLYQGGTRLNIVLEDVISNNIAGIEMQFGYGDASTHPYSGTVFFSNTSGEDDMFTTRMMMSPDSATYETDHSFWGFYGVTQAFTSFSVSPLGFDLTLTSRDGGEWKDVQPTSYVETHDDGTVITLPTNFLETLGPDCVYGVFTIER